MYAIALYSKWSRCCCVLRDEDVDIPLLVGPIFRDSTNDLDHMDDPQLVASYRMNRVLILDICEEAYVATRRQTNRSMALPVSLQVRLSGSRPAVFNCDIGCG